jgi:hypothetical protein
MPDDSVDERIHTVSSGRGRTSHPTAILSAWLDKPMASVSMPDSSERHGLHRVGITRTVSGGDASSRPPTHWGSRCRYFNPTIPWQGCASGANRLCMRASGITRLMVSTMTKNMSLFFRSMCSLSHLARDVVVRKITSLIYIHIAKCIYNNNTINAAADWLESAGNGDTQPTGDAGDV